jgi:hypothetical protein
MNKVEQFIATVRDSFIGSQEVYTRGSCLHFYKILKQVFPDAECWYDQDHILTRIDNRFYDITGQVSIFMDYEKIKEEDMPPPGLNKPFNIYKIK